MYVYITNLTLYDGMLYILFIGRKVGRENFPHSIKLRINQIKIWFVLFIDSWFQ